MQLYDFKEYYMAVPKDTDISLLGDTGAAVFVFARKEERETFLEKNQALKWLPDRTILLQDCVDNVFIVNDKKVYFQFFIPKLIARGFFRIYLYEDNALTANFSDISVTELSNLPSGAEASAEAAKMKQLPACPICQCREIEIFSDFFKNIDDIGRFEIVDGEYIFECTRCKTHFRGPLKIDTDFRSFGTNYYDQMPDVSGSRPATIKKHILENQKPHYDDFRTYMHKKLPSGTFKKWLDVGSGGYPTSFTDYDFTTIEPDPLTVSIGKELFHSERIFCSVLEDHKPDALYDGILFHHSFYCLDNPSAALQQVSAITRDDAVVAIAIAHYYTDTYPPLSPKGFYRLEDIYRGETVYVYYNSYSLTYLFESHGYELIDSLCVPHLNKDQDETHASRYFIFRKRKVHKNSKLLSRSAAYMQDKYTATFNQWKTDTEKSLKELDKTETVFVGDIPLFKELNSIYKLKNISGFHTPYCEAYQNAFIEGHRAIGTCEFTELTGKDIIICSCDYKSIFDYMRYFNLDKTNNIFAPVRQSGIKTLFSCIKGTNTINKSFEISEITI